MSLTVSEVISNMQAAFKPEAWGSQDAVLVFNITGDQGGQWVARIEGGQLSVSEGAAEAPDMTMTCDSKDLLALVTGELNAVSVFMQGKVKIDGNMSLAMKLQNLLGA